MLIGQDELVTLIQKVVNKRSRVRINKRTSKEELVNEAYIYIMERTHLLDKFKGNPSKERGYIVKMVRTAIVRFYIALDVIKLPPLPNRKTDLSILDQDIPTYNEANDNTVEILYEDKEMSFEYSLWKDYISDALDTLTNVETYVIESRYYNEAGNKKTLHELAEELHVSRVRVHQIEEIALEKLYLYYIENKSPDENNDTIPSILK